MVGGPVNVKPPELLSSRFLKVAPEIVLLLPFINIFPVPVPVCVADPKILPLTVNVFPPSLKVPELSVRLPIIVLPNAEGKVTVVGLFKIRCFGPGVEGKEVADAV